MRMDHVNAYRQTGENSFQKNVFLKQKIAKSMPIANMRENGFQENAHLQRDYRSAECRSLE